MAWTMLVGLVGRKDPGQRSMHCQAALLLSLRARPEREPKYVRIGLSDLCHCEFPHVFTDRCIARISLQICLQKVPVGV